MHNELLHPDFPDEQGVRGLQETIMEPNILSSETADKENLRLLYKENGEITRVYLEWRHKVMSRFFLTTAGILFIARWMYENDALRPLIWVPFLLGAIFSFSTALMDNVNSRILGGCYRYGEKMEILLSSEAGVYGIANHEFTKHPITYSKVLKTVYWGTTILSIIVSFLTYKHL